MPILDKTLCHLRWGYPNISLSRNEIRTCCKTPFQKVNFDDMETHKIELFLNNPYQLERRLEMLKGIRHSDCGQCWQVEDQGANSLRGNSAQGFIDFANNRNMFDEFNYVELDDLITQVKIDSNIVKSNRPVMLEVSLGNTCDLKCMYCNHVYSSQWATESLKHNKISIETYNEVNGSPNQKFIDLFWQWLDTEAKYSLERIGIIGGEPLITPDFYPFLEKLLETYKDCENKNTTIWIVTNLNTPDSYFNKLLDFIPKLNEKFTLEILISMESIKEQAEYIRNGLNWTRFENNVYKLFTHTKNNEKVTLGFLPSITALSVPKYKDFIEWVYKVTTDTEKPAMLKQNIVTWPNPHTPFILTPNFADNLHDAIEFIKTKQNNMPDFSDYFGRWETYCTFLENLRDSIKNNNKDQTELRQSFYKWFVDFDNLRNLNFVETFPELKEFYKMCGELNDRH